ncbi:MAG: glycosyltransferase family 39 protein, partial [Thermoflexales bacterium]
MKLNWLVLICGVSVASRVAAALIMGNNVESLPGIADQGSYHALALRLLGGHGFTFATDWWPATRAGEPTAHWSFLYTFYLAGVYAVFGAQPIIARLLQAVIVGVAWPVLSWRLGRRMGGETVGHVAAGWSAVYGYFAYYGGALMTEPLYITGILLTLDLALRIGDGRRRWRDWLFLGLVMGATILLRQLFLLFIPFLLGWLALKIGRGVRRADLAGAFAALAVVGLMIAPFTIRNYRAFGRFVLLNTNSGYAFFFGNHPIYGSQFQAILSGAVGYYELIPKQLLP